MNASEFSILSKETLTCKLEQAGIEAPTFQPASRYNLQLLRLIWLVMWDRQEKKEDH